MTKVVAKKIQAIRGMNDCLPEQTPTWQAAESTLRQLMSSYGYAEVRMPIMETTGLFRRAIGEVTDVVEKEMYTFDDRNGESMTLRPEGTAGCVRAGIEHGLLYNQERRMWYMVLCFATSAHKKAVTVSFISLASKCLAYMVQT